MNPMDGWLRAAMQAGLAGIVVAAVACGGPQEPAGEGEDCYRDADCQVGLVCVPTTGGARACSKNISGLVDQVVTPPPPEPPEPPEDAGTMDDAAAPMDDAAVPMDDAAVPMDDAAAPMDDAAAPMDDAAAPMDPPPDGG